MRGLDIDIDSVAEDAPCECGDCEWKGPFSDLMPPDGAVLTPGDPSPAGRCPDCDALAYQDNEAGRMFDNRRALLDLAAEVADGLESMAGPHDRVWGVELCKDKSAELRELIAKIKGA